MTSCIGIIFILSSYVSIFNVPESHGYSNQGYHLSSLSKELNDSERFMYTFFGLLPPRIYYSYKNRCYMVRGKSDHYKNNLRRKKGKGYKVVPRWQYYLNKLSPMGLMKSGMDCLSMGKTLMLGGDYKDADEEEFSEIGGADANADGGADDNADGGADANADGGADDGNDGDEGPGFLSKGINMGKGMVSPLLNLFGDSKNTNNNNNNKGINMGMDMVSPLLNLFGGPKDTNNDNNNKKKDDKEEDPVDYTEVAKDILTSDLTKNAIKTGLLFVPGGAGISNLIDAYSKYQAADEKLDKLEDKIPKFK